MSAFVGNASSVMYGPSADMIDYLNATKQTPMYCRIKLLEIKIIFITHDIIK